MVIRSGPLRIITYSIIFDHREN